MGCTESTAPSGVDQPLSVDQILAEMDVAAITLRDYPLPTWVHRLVRPALVLLISCRGEIRSRQLLRRALDRAIEADQ